MAVGDKYKLNVKWLDTATQLTAQNSFALRVDAMPTIKTVEEDIFDTFEDSSIRAFYTSLVHQNYYIVGYSLLLLPEELVVAERAIPADINHQGQISGDMLPPQITCVVSLRTNLLGRRGRGRIYLPPTGESRNTAAGFVSSLHIDEANSLCGNIVAGLDGSVSEGEYTWGVWSRENQTFNAVNSWIPRNRWANQRGRKF